MTEGLWKAGLLSLADGSWVLLDFSVFSFLFPDSSVYNTHCFCGYSQKGLF